ncbi:MAG: 3-oxoacyl-[acyl-carrier-protein] reductase [Elusimicrobia bacterium CG11_big_fil_rev_8_21_14_0_20_64_6]|nr:MAG: 3-oxoacyl-[acyl-carrier-protein] reductase [Elusimicrobia bacterium CG11_big_fil_rev_8_21_14_0_20_64_6]
MRLKDKVAVITGSAQGIGLATAELFVAEGARVAIVDVDAAKAEAAARALDAGRGVCFGLACDVTKFADCESVVKTVVEKWGKLDILVNNAGVTKDNLVMRISEADWNFVLDVNLKGAFNFTKAAIRPMMKARYGKIVNLSSIVGLEGAAGQANYAASKGGVIALTKSIAREFASRSINANAVAPGFIRTRLTDAIPEDAKKKLLERILLGRVGEPVEIARATLFLSSDEASYITGHVLSVNGGVYM